MSAEYLTQDHDPAAEGLDGDRPEADMPDAGPDTPASDAGAAADGAAAAGAAAAGRETEPWRIVLGELDEKMGVKVLEQSARRVVGTMPIEGNRQSFGLLHGGASLAFGEALGSWAAVIHAGPTHTAVGVDVSATHHRSARSGLVTGVATAIHLGRTLTSHEVIISDEDGHRLCTLRITNLILPRKKAKA